MTVKIAGSLPSGDANGLETIVSMLIHEPGSEHIVIATVDCRKVTTDFVTDDVTPTARIRRIEVVVDDEERKRVLRVLQRAFERRTGREMLPLELEDQITFDDPDDET